MSDELIQTAMEQNPRAAEILASTEHDKNCMMLITVIDGCDCSRPIRAAIAALSTRNAEEVAAPPVKVDEVERVAYILESWDMKEPPCPGTGHSYQDIARDILAALRSTNGRSGND